MPNFKPTAKDFLLAEVKGKQAKVLKKEALDSFNASVLGLGDLTKESSATDTIAAVFDLEGFTNFCKQIEPHLSVPLFLSKFLDWLMEQLKREMIQETIDSGSKLWSPLPFFSKFMGDGLLVLWDASEATPMQRLNIIISAQSICGKYQSEFHKAIRAKVSEPPPVLRCGLARGTVYSVGEQNDYVGSCINMAARLQKLPGLTFAFNQRGFDLEKQKNDYFTKNYVTKTLAVRGIGDSELVCVLTTEYAALRQKDKKDFRDV